MDGGLEGPGVLPWTGSGSGGGDGRGSLIGHVILVDGGSDWGIEEECC